jgi:hypothetical protein
LPEASFKSVQHIHIKLRASVPHPFQKPSMPPKRGVFRLPGRILVGRVPADEGNNLCSLPRFGLRGATGGEAAPASAHRHRVVGPGQISSPVPCAGRQPVAQAANEASFSYDALPDELLTLILELAGQEAG